MKECRGIANNFYFAHRVHVRIRETMVGLAELVPPFLEDDHALDRFLRRQTRAAKVGARMIPLVGMTFVLCTP